MAHLKNKNEKADIMEKAVESKIPGTRRSNSEGRDHSTSQAATASPVPRSEELSSPAARLVDAPPLPRAICTTGPPVQVRSGHSMRATKYLLHCLIATTRA